MNNTNFNVLKENKSTFTHEREINGRKVLISIKKSTENHKYELFILQKLKQKDDAIKRFLNNHSTFSKFNNIVNVKTSWSFISVARLIYYLVQNNIVEVFPKI